MDADEAEQQLERLRRSGPVSKIWFSLIYLNSFYLFYIVYRLLNYLTLKQENLTIYLNHQNKLKDATVLQMMVLTDLII